VPRNQFNLPASLADTRTVPLTYAPVLSNGDHVLEFSAADNLGNRATAVVRNNVALDFGLLEMANYPNPVDGDFTTFYFFVGDHADRYELKVYTIAGRHIRTIEGGYAAGVTTFTWDLTDQDDRKIANGVYFYTIAVSQGGRTAKQTGKMAILR
jgi:flagellar hook assembly protein FlgD